MIKNINNINNNTKVINKSPNEVANCFSNINIFTNKISNISSIQAKEVTLKQYIMNKSGKQKELKKYYKK